MPRTLRQMCVSPTRFQAMASGGSCGSKWKISTTAPPGKRIHPILQVAPGASTPKNPRTRSGGASESVAYGEASWLWTPAQLESHLRVFPEGQHCVERDRAALRALHENLDALDLTGRAKVLSADALSVAATIDADIVFADPPYEFDSWAELLGRVRADLVIAEAGSSVDAPMGWTVTRDKKYGRTRVTFLERTGDLSASDAQ